jgi:hypothetical protein
VPPQDEEESTIAVESRAPTAPLPFVPATAVEEGEATTETTATQVDLETPTEAGSSGEGIMVVLDEDSAPPAPSESRDVVMAPMSEPAQVMEMVSLPAAVEVSEPSPEVGVLGPPLTAEVAETSSARGALTAEEVMELATCWYIDFPGVGVIDIETPSFRRRCTRWRQSGCSTSRRSWRRSHRS